MKQLIKATLLLFFLISVGCKNSKNTTQKEDYAQQGFLKATVTKFNLDGCSFVLTLEDGKKLEPINIPTELKIADKKIWLKYVSPKKQLFSTCMAGEMVEIIDWKER